MGTAFAQNIPNLNIDRCICAFTDCIWKRYFNSIEHNVSSNRPGKMYILVHPSIVSNGLGSKLFDNLHHDVYTK